MLGLLNYSGEKKNKNVIECNRLTNDMIFLKYNVSEGDIIHLKDNQFVIMFEKGKVLDVKEKAGDFIVGVANEVDENVSKDWDNLVIRKSENEKLCVIFLNINVISHNKYTISDPIKYVDWKNNESSEIYIKLEGFYDFKIENPKMLFSKVIGLRVHFSKQELIEKIRKFILNSIEEGINEISEEYKLDINTLASKSKELEIRLKQNEHDLKLLEYGVKLTYFDITNFEVTKRKFKIF